jgi:hypothetical protein
MNTSLITSYTYFFEQEAKDEIAALKNAEDAKKLAVNYISRIYADKPEENTRNFYAHSFPSPVGDYPLSAWHTITEIVVPNVLAALNLNNSELATLYKDLAAQMNGKGYADLTVAFADTAIELYKNSETLDHANIALAMGFKAYAVGLIKGDYDAGLTIYEDVIAYTKANSLEGGQEYCKALSNSGQIYHRLGMHTSAYYVEAIKYFDAALEAIESSTFLKPEDKNMFIAQAYYSLAKTEAAIAELSPQEFNKLDVHKDRETFQSFAMVHIAQGIERAGSVENFDARMACFVAVRGRVHAVTGDLVEAKKDLVQALDGQTKFGMPLPRRMSTKLKLIDVQERLGMAPEQANEERVKVFTDLKAWGWHSDISAYAVQHPNAFKAASFKDRYGEDARPVTPVLRSANRWSSFQSNLYGN